MPTAIAMTLTRDQELWGIALWLEQQHGEHGWFHIAQQKDRLLAAGDFDGIAMWTEVERRVEMLKAGTSSN